MQFTDLAVVAGTRRRDDGYLVADARIARTGIQTYLGIEVGQPDKATVRVYRPGAEVFSDATLKSAAHRPVTNDHPPELVNSTNWKDFAVGQTGDEVTGEAIFIRVPLMVSDEAAIKDIEAGKRELSAGYTCDLDFTPGQTPSGEAYDAIQKNIRLNHVAIVQRGRAGSKVRIGDGAAQWGAAPISDANPDKEPTMTLKTVTVDGIPIEVTDQGATVIATLQQRIADAATKATETATSHAAALAAKDKDIATRDAQIDDLKKKIVDGAALDKLVASRADLVNKAKVLAKDVKTDGLTDAEIKRAVVVAVVGDSAKDKAEAYIDARFEILVEDAQKKAGKDADPFAAALQDGIQSNSPATKIGDAYNGMVTDLQDAWKQKGAA